MLKSFWVYDTSAEKEVAKFLDKHLYSQPIFSDFIRVTDKENQFKGRDVIFSFEELKKIIVDEKAQSDYVNKNLPTFAFEIDFLNKNGQHSDGWLFNNKKETEYYLLIWITATKERDFLEQDITQLECYLISRKKIIDFLNNQKLNMEKCSKISEELRAKNKSGVSHKGEFSCCYFFFSTNKVEQPINVLIYKSKLKELSTKIFEVKNTD